MSDHLTPQQIGSYRSRQISAEELRRIDEHVADCPDCAHLLRSPEQTTRDLAALRALTAPTEPLSYEQLEAYVEGTLSPEAQQDMVARVRTDPRAQADVESLRAAQTMVTDEPVRPPAARSESGPERARPAAPRLGWRGGVPALGSAFAAALLVWAGGMRPLLQQNATLRGEVQQFQQADRQQLQTFQTALDKARAEGAEQARITAQQAAQQLAQAQKQRDMLTRQNEALTLELHRQKQATAATRQQNTRLARNNRDISRDLTRLRLASTSRASVRIAANHSELAAIASALTHETLPIHISANLTGTAPPLSRDGEEPASPAGTAVLSDRPALRWNPLAGAASYQVLVTDKRDKPVAQTDSPLTATQWTIPTPLPRGQVYCWQVRPLDSQSRPLNNKIFTKLCFEVLSSEALSRYLDAELKLAILFAHDGLYDSAESLLEEVAGADTANPLCAQAARLRQDIRQQRHKAAK